MTLPHLVVPQHCGDLDWARAERHTDLTEAETAATEHQAEEDRDGTLTVWRVFELREPVWTGHPRCALCRAFRAVGRSGVCWECTQEQGWQW